MDILKEFLPQTAPTPKGAEIHTQTARFPPVEKAPITTDAPQAQQPGHRRAVFTKNRERRGKHMERSNMAMPATTINFHTPHYVLLDGNYRIGPAIVQSDSGIESTAIFGFSGKGAYDIFDGHDQRALKPYPLVKGYLRIQISAPVARLNLVVIDAAGPGETVLHAATMEAVLEAQEKRTPHVTTECQLVFDQKANAYRAAYFETA